MRMTLRDGPDTVRLGMADEAEPFQVLGCVIPTLRAEDAVMGMDPGTEFAAVARFPGVLEREPPKRARVTDSRWGLCVQGDSSCR